MGPSHSLMKRNVIPWFTEITPAEEDLDMLLSVTASDLYHVGKVAIDKIKQQYSSTPVVQAWPSVFSGICVISNRRTLFHRDQGGWPACFDLLAAMGTYQTSELLCPDIGARFVYNPGTVIPICGKLLRHGVFEWEGGERLCYAHYMRNNVHDRLGLRQTTWVDRTNYTRHMSPRYLNRMAASSSYVVCASNNME